MEEGIIVFGEAPALLCRNGHQVNCTPWCEEEDDASSQGFDKTSAFHATVGRTTLIGSGNGFHLHFPPFSFPAAS